MTDLRFKNHIQNCRVCFEPFTEGGNSIEITQNLLKMYKLILGTNVSVKQVHIE